MGDTKIQWTGKTWNPIRARSKATGEVGWFCEHVSHGCDHCYAEKMNVNTYFGNGVEYKASNLPQLELFLDEKMLAQPLHWRRSQKVFVCSMTDLFGRFVSDEWIEKIFQVMAQASQHTFQVLTKRPERMRDMSHNVPGLLDWANVWLGTSVEDQKTADKRIPELLETAAIVRWISAEPLLGPIELANLKDGTFNALDGIDFENIGDIRDAGVLGKGEISGLDWVVVGGESGPNARSLDLNWIKSIVSQCQGANIPVFVKQLGYRPWWDGMGTKAPAGTVYLESKVMFGKVGWQFDCMDRKGGKIEEWPEDLRVREFPKAVA